jgi:hypothetical protein
LLGFVYFQRGEREGVESVYVTLLIVGIVT